MRDDGQPKSPATKKLVSTGLIHLHVTEYGGDAEPLILLHGIGSRETSWWPVIDHLAAHFRLIVPDLRGHGDSDKPDHGYLIPDYAGDLAGLLSAYEIDRPRIIGHSLGGMISLAWASGHPAQARCLVIEDSPLRRARDVASLFDGWIALASMTPTDVAARYAAEYPAWTPAECLRRAESITSTHLAVFEEMKQRNVGAVHSDRMTHVAKIETPTLLVHGDVESGGMVPAADAERFKALLKSSSVTRIPGGSHSLHRDKPGEFLAAVVPYLLAH